MKKYISISLLALFVNTSFVFAQKRETRNVSTFSNIVFRIPGKLYLKQGSPQKVEIESSAETLSKIETEVDGDKLLIEQKDKWFNSHNEDKINVYITVENIDGLNVGGSGDLIAETKISSNELDLNVSGSGSLTAEIDVKGNVDADVSGSGNIDLKGKCQNLESDVSGSGHVELAINITDKADFGVSGSGKIGASGSAGSVKASISGSGKVMAANLETNKCDIRISGSGSVEINVKDDLNAQISGSGNVSYKGNPSRVNSTSSGSGKVRKM